MSITITAEGMDAAMEHMRETLEAVGEQKARAALARALNRTLTAVRTEATRIARTTYTARRKKLFDNIFISRAGRGKLEGVLEIHGSPGVSLIHFEATPNRPQRPAARPADGVSARILRSGSRKVARSHKSGGSKSFVIRKPQGGYGVFVRHGQKLEMLFGPSPVQALQRADSQERLIERADEVFPRRLRHELDVLLSGLVRG
ncbi:hypothetical protein [uncultured Desulfovibrio sp.]|uniref:hypothetical protein n=1 Tax=uncultured Desulfovibrio sp. TaxID=167968 RepID=UPI00261E94DE|nr:hypothetical protein [uncultured Desulfovibrio sp.]